MPKPDNRVYPPSEPVLTGPRFSTVQLRMVGGFYAVNLRGSWEQQFTTIALRRSLPAAEEAAENLVRGQHLLLGRCDFRHEAKGR